MDVRIAHESEHPAFDTPERVSIVEIWNVLNDEPVSIAKATVDPGIETQLHALDGVTERQLVVQGSGLADVGDQRGLRLVVGDVLFIPPGVPERLVNDGQIPLVLYCICSPRFTPASYRDLEQV